MVNLISNVLMKTEDPAETALLGVESGHETRGDRIKSTFGN